MTVWTAWTMEQALAYIRPFMGPSHRRGYNLCLGGGVLERGGSNNDLDIICVPANALSGEQRVSDQNYDAYLTWLSSLYPSEVKRELGWWNDTMQKFAFYPDDRKIDWFIIAPGSRFKR